MTEEISKLEKGTSLWKDAWYRLVRNKAALVSGIYVLVLVLIALATPWITPYEFDAINYSDIGTAPSPLHWFGADVLGRDLFTRCLFGLRISLGIGITASFVSFIIGVTYGAIAGYVGGKVGAVMMRIVDTIDVLPYILLVIILMTIFGRNIILLFAAIGAVAWLTMARIVRGQILSLKNKEFIEAARAIGVKNSSIIFRHSHGAGCYSVRGFFKFFGAGRSGPDGLAGESGGRRGAGDGDVSVADYFSRRVARVATVCAELSG